MPEIVEYLDGRYGLLGLLILAVAVILYRRGLGEAFASPPNEVTALLRQTHALMKGQLDQFEANNKLFEQVRDTAAAMNHTLTSLDQKAATLQGMLMGTRK